MRKISVGNKGRFATFTIIIITIVVIMLLGLKTSLGMEKTKYSIENGSFLYDIEYSPIKLEEDATLKQKWNGNYYLTEGSKEEQNIGKYAVIYKQKRRALELHGKFFEIESDGSITKYFDKSEINDTSKDRFFKIDDRKYLIVSRNITNPTRSLSTKDYLIVILDKAGNAQIMNHEVNAKMLNQTFIDTPTFQFDIANEKLLLPEKTLDLKKIIGSTNEYKEKEQSGHGENESEEQETNNTTEENQTSSEETVQQNGENAGGNSGGNSGETIIEVNTGGGNSGGSTSTITTVGGTVNPTSGGSNLSGTSSGTTTKVGDNGSNENQNLKFEKSVTLNKVTAGASYIDVSYYIVDPQGQYKTVYMIVDGGNSTRTIALDKGSTQYRITKLEPNTNYKITVGSKTVGTKGTTVDTIEDVVETRTIRNKSTLKVTKISGGRIYFNLKLDSSYIIDSGKIAIYNNSEYKESMPINIQSAYTSSGWSSSFAYEPGKEITLKLEDVKYNGENTNYNLYAKVKN